MIKRASSLFKRTPADVGYGSVADIRPWVRLGLLSARSRHCRQLVKTCKNSAWRALHPPALQLLAGSYYPDRLAKTPRTCDY